MSDQIVFNSIPVNFLIPGFYAEFDSSRAGQPQATVPPKLLLVGQKLAAGNAPAGVPVRVFSKDQAGQLAGRGSMLALMAAASLKANPFTPTYILPLADANGSTKSTRTLPVTGPAIAPGTLALAIGGKAYPIGVAIGDAVGVVATAIVNAVTADADAPVTAASAAGVVTLTARNAGLDAGAIDVSINIYDGEALPGGIGVSVSALTPGATNPQVAASLTALGDQWFPSFAVPYTDATNLDALEAELLDRFGPIRQIDGYAFTAASLAVADAITLGGSRNSPLVSICDAGDVLSPAYVVAATVAAIDAAEPDPGRPRQALALPGLVGRTSQGRRTRSQRNQLIAGGISTLIVDVDGTVLIERLTTTYRTNSFGVSDTAYFDREQLSLLANLRYSARVRFATKYPRHKLGRDGSTGDNVMTPAVARAEYVSLYVDTWMSQGWVEGGTTLALFKADLVCTINAGDPNRLDARVSPDLINQWRIGATQIQFRR